jgi:dipeptidyl aminopeptidase/acylaminoacyl peptidase
MDDPGVQVQVRARVSERDDLDHLGGAWPSPDGRHLVVVSDRGGRPQPWIVDTAEVAGWRELKVPGSVERCVWRPDGQRILVQTDTSGHEDFVLTEVDPISGRLEWIVAEPGVRAEIGLPYGSVENPYNPDGSLLAYACNARDRACFDIIVRDLRTGADRTVLVGDDRYFPAGFSPDSAMLLVQRHHQRTEHDLFLCDLRDGNVRHLTPHEGPAKYFPAGWAPEAGSVFVCTTQGRDFLGLAELSLDDGTLKWLDTPEHDIEGAAVSADGTRLAWGVNVDGYTRLRWLDRTAGSVRDIDSLPDGVCVQEDGASGYALRFMPGGVCLLVQLGRPAAATELYTVDLAGGTARQLTRCGSRLPRSAATIETRRFTSGDGTSVPALLYRPDGATRTSPVPVVVFIHGGPEYQAFPVYDPLIHALLDRGIGILAPNTRGSSGLGLHYQRLIYRDWGGGDLADLKAAAQFLDSLEWVDGTRLGVYGASYGGFAAMGCLTRLPELWRVGVSEAGISDLLSDVRNFPPAWKHRIAAWIGDPADPDDQDRMRAASPLTHAHQLRAPLLLVHGSNDTRAVVEASERMHQRLTELGLPVRFIRNEGVGHGSADRAMRVRTAREILEWLTSHLTADG